jgi:hypothetical protein
MRRTRNKQPRHDCEDMEEDSEWSEEEQDEEEQGSEEEEQGLEEEEGLEEEDDEEEQGLEEEDDEEEQGHEEEEKGHAEQQEEEHDEVQESEGKMELQDGQHAVCARSKDGMPYLCEILDANPSAHPDRIVVHWYNRVSKGGCWHRGWRDPKDNQEIYAPVGQKKIQKRCYEPVTEIISTELVVRHGFAVEHGRCPDAIELLLADSCIDQ